MAFWLLRMNVPLTRRIFTLVLLHLNLIHCILMLQPPGRLTMESINMRHTLRWRPLQTPCSTAALYSVQYQGEFERTAPNVTWLDVFECQNIPHTHCDVTLDLVSDSDYNIRIRAQCESQISQWTCLSPPFNRKDTLLTVPQMAVSVVGYALLVTFDQPPPTASINVTVWKRGDQAQADVYTILAEEKVLRVAALQEGAVYCLKAHMILEQLSQTGSTEIHCVPIKGTHAPWKSTTTVVVTLVLMAGVLIATFWTVVHCRAHDIHQCYYKEPLPSSLRSNDFVQTALSMYQVEECDIVCVESHDSGERDHLRPGLSPVHYAI
ncbi:interleukin-20 receptor subunit beta isoform X1 [Nerophis lumbriciformis]|uniref:interleukin-20 receptor subunit beta isoform X1 n=2 Tax=Nerophis lumbriciformis TaxID=546530 RepID=UPI002AE032F4|nr:interleukin-20 receptor subunit beta-like isoform X1 [Nerophis lumbriciformis]